MQIAERTVLKIATVKTFICNINISKSQTAGIQPDNFLVGSDIFVNGIFNLIWFWNMFKTIIRPGCNVPVFINSGQCCPLAGWMNACI